MAISDFFKSLGSNVKQYVNNLPSIPLSGINKMFGTGLTPSEQQANAFTERMDSTKYQRGVADMEAAGLNPALMYGSAGATSAPSSVSPSTDLGALMQMISLGPQIQQMKAQTENIEADTANKNVQTELNSQLLGFNEQFNPLILEGKEIANDLSRTEIRQLDAAIDKIIVEQREIIARTETEEEKKMLVHNQAALEKLKYEQAVELFPYTVKLTEAQTQAQRAVAAFDFAQAAYQKHLIDDGYLDAIIGEAKSHASSAEAKANLDHLESDIRTGRVLQFDNKVAQGVADVALNYPLATLSNLAHSISQVVNFSVVAGRFSTGKKGAYVPHSSSGAGGQFGF